MAEKAPAASFADLRVWQKSHALALNIYALTSTFPKHELFGLTLAELRYYLILAGDLGYLPRGSQTEELDEASRMLSAYERTILWSARALTSRTVIATSVFCILYSVF